MRTILFLLAAALWIGPVGAAESPGDRGTIDGTWHWTFRMPDGSEVTPKVKLKQEGEALSGKTSHRTGTETSITNGTVRADEIAFDVLRTGHGSTNITHYTGKRAGDVIHGKVETTWDGHPRSYDWEAHRNSGIDGTWKWKVLFGEREIDLRVTLKLEGEKLTGKMPSFGRRETSIKNGTFKNGELYFEVERGREDSRTVQKFRGTLQGDQIKGETETIVDGDPQIADWLPQRSE